MYAIGLVAWVLFSIFASEFLSYYIFRLLLKIFHFETGTLLQSAYSAFIYLLAIAIMIGVPALLKKANPEKFHFKKPSREELGLRGLPTWTDILLSPVGFIAQYFLSALFVAFFTIFPWFNAEEAQETGYSELLSAPDRLIAFLIIAVIAPIAEEIIFRGYLYGKLRSRLSLPAAAILTSLLFAFVHGQWNVAVNVFALSVVACLLRETTGTIYSGILVHVLKNALAFYIIFIAMS